jgi:hypothetical protein
VLAGLAPSPARACSLCGCGDPLLAASDPAAITGRFRLQLDADLQRMDAGFEGQPGFTDQLTQWSYRLNAVYRPIEPIALSVTVPFLHKTLRTVGGGADVLASDLSGVGDLEVAVRWAPWRSVNLGLGRVHELSLALGTSLPTGSTDGKGPDGALADPHGQLGTGSWGPFVGAGYRFEQGRWLAFANASYRWRSEGTSPDGSRYQFGAALLWSVHGQYRPVRRVAVDLGVDGRTASADRATAPDGVVEPGVENTGGTVLSLAPGVYLNATGPVWLFVRGQVPAYQHLLGVQTVHPSFTSGFQVEVW